MGCKFPLVMK